MGKSLVCLDNVIIWLLLSISPKQLSDVPTVIANVIHCYLSKKGT